MYIRLSLNLLQPRYLHDLKPPEMQRTEIMNRLDDVAWEEVLNFASAIGSAEFIVSELATGGEKGTIKRLERALSILVDPGTSVSLDLRTQIVKLAFDHVDSNETDDVFSLGSALAEVAKTYPRPLGAGCGVPIAITTVLDTTDRLDLRG